MVLHKNFVLDGYYVVTEEISRFARNKIHVIATFRDVVLLNSYSSLKQIYGVIIYTEKNYNLGLNYDVVIIKISFITINDKNVCYTISLTMIRVQKQTAKDEPLGNTDVFILKISD